MSLSQNNYSFVSWSFYRSYTIQKLNLKHYFYFLLLNISQFYNFFQTFGDNLQGFMNCLLYCVFTPKVFNHIKQKFITCCKCSSPTCCTLRSHGRYLESFDTEEEEGANLFKKWNDKFVSHVIKFIGEMVTSRNQYFLQQYSKN